MLGRCQQMLFPKGMAARLEGRSTGGGIASVPASRPPGSADFGGGVPTSVVRSSPVSVVGASVGSPAGLLPTSVGPPVWTIAGSPRAGAFPPLPVSRLREPGSASDVSDRCVLPPLPTVIASPALAALDPAAVPGACGGVGDRGILAELLGRVSELDRKMASVAADHSKKGAVGECATPKSTVTGSSEEQVGAQAAPCSTNATSMSKGDAAQAQLPSDSEPDNPAAQSAKNVMRPKEFDGKKPINSDLAHFRVCAEFNKWTEDEKRSWLKWSLKNELDRRCGTSPAVHR